MTYLSRLIEETGLVRAGGVSSRRLPVSETVAGLIEVEETAEVTSPQPTSLATPVQPSADTALRSLEPLEVRPMPPGLAARRHIEEVRVERAQEPGQARLPSPARATEPQAPRPVAEIDVIEAEVTVPLQAPMPERRVEPPAPRAPHEQEAGMARTLRTIDAVRRWVAAVPEALAIDAGVDAASEEVERALRLVFEPTPALRVVQESRAGPRAEVGLRGEAEPGVQNVTLSIGSIELTVEAPEQVQTPARPAPAKLPAMEESAAQRLRRHYVNWPGGV